MKKNPKRTGSAFTFLSLNGIKTVYVPAPDIGNVILSSTHNQLRFRGRMMTAAKHY